MFQINAENVSGNHSKHLSKSDTKLLKSHFILHYSSIPCNPHQVHVPVIMSHEILGAKFREYYSSDINASAKDFCQKAILQGVQREGRKKQVETIQKIIAAKYGNPTIVTQSKDSFQWAQGVSWCYIVQYESWIYNINCCSK